MIREEALEQLDAFVPRMVSYAGERNRVVPGHTNVSRLSPAIRHRLITEDEVAAAALQHHGFGAVEKLVQEVYWRYYWKSWLELRPGVWSSYREDLTEFGSGARRAADKVLGGHSGIEIFDYFANELISTGYLHNHARMWFAAIWIHEFKLPWQLGADFFHRYLLDGDPASNTLSWRWVAGLHTAGKNYLARASNLEQYLAPEILEVNRGGLERIRQPAPAFEPTNEGAPPPVSLPDLSYGEPLGEKTGFWLHEDDLSPELDCISDSVRMAVVNSSDLQDEHRYSPLRCDWISSASAATAARLGDRAECLSADDTAAALVEWAEGHQLKTIVAYQPWVGPVRDRLPEMEERLSKSGNELRLFRKPADEVWVPLAPAGFFGFWKKLQRKHPLLKELT